VTRFGQVIRRQWTDSNGGRWVRAFVPANNEKARHTVVPRLLWEDPR